MSGVIVIRRSDVHYIRIRGTEGNYQDIAELFGADDGLGVMSCGMAELRIIIIEDWEYVVDDFVHILEGRFIDHVDSVP